MEDILLTMRWFTWSLLEIPQQLLQLKTWSYIKSYETKCNEYVSSENRCYAVMLIILMKGMYTKLMNKELWNFKGMKPSLPMWKNEGLLKRITVSHRVLTEVYTGGRNISTCWSYGIIQGLEQFLEQSSIPS